MIHYIKLLRPLQWLKNVFVFAPIFFSTNLLKPEYFWPTLVVFASFCLISSSIYCFNDLKDAEADRQHPKKCKRPIASGKVSVTGGYTMMLLCTIGALAIIPLAHSVNTHYLYAIIIGYWLMNIAYCLKLKQYAILDVSIIAIGFVMRVLVGGVTTDIYIRADWNKTPCINHRIQQDFHQRGHSHHRLCHTGVLHHVYHVARGHSSLRYTLCVPYIRMGACWIASLSAEYDCVWIERKSYEIAC